MSIKIDLWIEEHLSLNDLAEIENTDGFHLYSVSSNG